MLTWTLLILVGIGVYAESEEKEVFVEHVHYLNRCQSSRAVPC